MTMKCMTVVGTRPEFIQIAPLTKALRKHGTEILVNTGQHYDDNMSRVFFRDLELPEPDISLGVGSGHHAEQTGQMMIELESVMLREQPNWVIVYGDTNTTIAAALTAAKIHIPIAHVEAGLRSFDRTMPEEINRIVTDHISDILFAPTQVAIDNLTRENIIKGVHLVGDVRVDVLNSYIERARQKNLSEIVGVYVKEPFALATIHRASNTDEPERLTQVITAINALKLTVVIPVHPRLRKMMETFDLHFESNVHPVEPLGFLDMLAVLDACSVVITDSGGLQKEAYMLYRPTVTLRNTTEWVETVTAGWNRLCEPETLASAVSEALNQPPADHPDFYGALGASERMVTILQETARIQQPTVEAST